MSNHAERLEYDPRTGPDCRAWLSAPEAERTLAVRNWLKSNDMPFPCCVPRSTDQWREIEDQLASGVPTGTSLLLERLLAEGVERIVAVWAMAEATASERYRQLERQAGEAGDPESCDIRQLFEACDTAILPVAFEASTGGFGPAHETLIDYYHHHYDRDGSMPFAVAAGFCFGCAASPKFVRNQTLYEHMFGNEVAGTTPAYLPVADAYRELFRYVSDAVFDQKDPIPPSIRPPEEAIDCLDSPFSDWCKGFVAAGPVVSQGWESHLTGHPQLQRKYLEIAETLRFFASREEARATLASATGRQDWASSASRFRSQVDVAIRHLFALAHPANSKTIS